MHVVMHTNKIKQGITFSVIAIALLGVVLSTFAEDSGRIKKENILLQKFNQQSINSIGQYRFPLTVNSFVKDLGKPDSTFTDDSSETCPIGQVHSWCLKSQNLQVLVLGDNYDPRIDYSANCRLFAVAKCNSSKESKFKGLWGIKLGDSDKAVKEKLLRLAKNNRNVTLTQNNKRAPIHVFLNEFSISHHHTLKKDGHYFYFVINKDGMLEVILQSDMDLSIAC